MPIRIASTALLSLLLAGSCLAAAPVRVILVGDSTMATRTGYGDALCQRLVEQTSCINLARGGRSSGSFRAEGRWDKVQELLREPGPYAATYVLIQFGHNDQPGKPGRSTDLVRDFPANIARYASEVKALGGIPVLVTPLTRRSFRGQWLHNDLAPWSAAIRTIARSSGTALLDLNQLSGEAVQAMGTKQADTLAQEGAFDYTHLGAKGADVFSRIVAEQLGMKFPVLTQAMQKEAPQAPVALRQAAPADGWAAFNGGTSGGSAAHGDDTYTVTSADELRAALARPDKGAKIIQVAGIIDMRGGQPFASTADQAARSTIKLKKSTTLIGIGARSGFVHASVVVNNASQVIIRNLHFQNPCDVHPVWDPNDGSSGNWNAQFDSIVVSGSTQVWIDHNSFTDAPATDDTFPIENGKRKQCHDGALDINKGADFITVSYNHFALHDKNVLVGSGDGATGDREHLRVTFSHNLFENVSSRSPRVRYGRVHVFNNLYKGDRKHALYPHEYSIGVGKEADIISEANVFDVAKAKACKDVVRHYDLAASFSDRGSVFNGQALACEGQKENGWRIPYPYRPLPAADVTAHVLAYAGAGKPLAAPALLSPRSGDIAVPADTTLRIDLGYTPVLGAGTVNVYRQGDGALVDTIDTREELMVIGYRGQDPVRQVKYKPIRVRGNSVTIHPHSGKLAPGTSYLVTVDEGLFDRRGISKTMGWRFRTAPAVPVRPALTVDDDGPADFRTVQGALNHVMARYAKADPVTIKVNNGAYEELLFVRAKDKLTIAGESRNGVLIHGENNNGLNPGSGASQPAGAAPLTGGRTLMLAEESDLLTIENLTMENTTLRATGTGSQAETILFVGDESRLIVKNARFFSEQDTLQLRGYAWFYRTLVAGNVDFIWGANRVALFEESEIRTVGDSGKGESGGWLVQARSRTEQDKGFVFLNSVMTHGEGPTGRKVAPGATYFARSPGYPQTWDNVAFVNSRIDRHISPLGWARDGLNKQPVPNPPVASVTSGWREYNTRDLAGNPVDLRARAGGYQLTAEEAKREFGSRAAVFSAFDNGKGWNPVP